MGDYSILPPSKESNTLTQLLHNARLQSEVKKEKAREEGEVAEW